MPRTTVPVEYTRGYRRNPEFDPPETIPTDRFRPAQPVAASSDEAPGDDPAATQQEHNRAEQTDTPETDS